MNLTNEQKTFLKFLVIGGLGAMVESSYNDPEEEKLREEYLVKWQSLCEKLDENLIDISLISSSDLMKKLDDVANLVFQE